MQLKVSKFTFLFILRPNSHPMFGAKSCHLGKQMLFKKTARMYLENTSLMYLKFTAVGTVLSRIFCFVPLLVTKPKPKFCTSESKF